MRIDLTGKNALVMGGASGIGRACALVLAEAGARVAVVDVNLPPAEGFERVHYPRQIEAERRQQRSAGEIPIDPGLTQELEGLGKKFNIPFPA
jgi:NAD(P)-dependent dehydrogenase (short-subunit alcohol dehydrogenase family)